MRARSLVATLCLVLCAASGAATVTVAGDLDVIFAKLAARQHGHVEFIEQHFIAMLDRPTESSGELRYEAPDHLEKRTLAPRAETMTLQGDTLTIDRGKTHRTVDMRSYPQVLPFIESIRATLAGDRAALDKLFTLEFAGSLPRWTLTLVPRDAKIKRSVAQVRIDGAQDQLLKVEIKQADGDRSPHDPQARIDTMMRRAPALLVWLVTLALALLVVYRAHYLTDLSAFLPRKPTPAQQLLVDQLRDGPASRLVIGAIEGAEAAARAQVSVAMGAILRRDTQFASVNNGESNAEQADREFLFQHRYLLSDQIDAERFTASGLRGAIGETIDDLASPAGLLFKSLLPRDPTGELLHLVDQLGPGAGPISRHGVWVSPDEARALLVAETAAPGSDTDAQARAIDAIQAAFTAALSQVKPAATGLKLRLSGPGVFAVAARAKIERAALRLSIISSVLVVTLLLLVYRSLTVLALGLLPVASAALVGVAAVALGFGVVHGITLGFGITLIGESVDYSIYFFLQSRAGGTANAAARGWQQRWWPTVRLGMLTSVCGFVSLLPSGFPGLQQLGLYSIAGLVCAALVTRFVLPVLQPARLQVRDMTPMGAALQSRLDPVRRVPRLAAGGALLLAAVALSVLVVHRDRIWNHELSALSPISEADLTYDTLLRSDLGAADVRAIVVVSGAAQESALRAAEATAAALRPLVDARVIARFDSPADFLPSMATQERRRAGLPAPAALKDNLRQASAGLSVRADRLQPFLEDVEAARHGALVSARDLKGTTLNAGFESMMLHQRDRWSALLPLHPGAAGQDIDLARVAATLPAEARVLDLKRESDALYGRYLHEAVMLSLAGLGALGLLLLVALRSPLRALRVLAPLILSVLCVAAGLVLAGVQLTILHLVGMLLIVAVGSNYALFFDRQRHDEPASAALTLASLAVANAATVIGFGLLSFSQVPVLEALGMSVAPGAFLALLFAALLAPADHA